MLRCMLCWWLAGGFGAWGLQHRPALLCPQQRKSQLQKPCRALLPWPSQASGCLHTFAPPAYGAGGAVYLTSNAGFTEVSFQSNSAPSGGAVGVGQSSSGIYFNGCTFNVSCTPPSLAACQSVSREC